MKKRNLYLLFILMFATVLIIGCKNKENKNHFLGIIEGETFTISSPVSEKLIELSVNEGDVAVKNEKIGMLDTTALHLQKESIIAKQQQLMWQERELVIRLEQIEDLYNHSKDKYRKNLKLQKSNAIPGQVVKDLKLQLQKFEKEKRIVRAKAKAIKSGKDNLKQQILLIRDKIGKAVLVAPANGFFDKIYYEKGEYVPPMMPIADLVNLENVWCYIYVSENALSQLSAGQQITGKISGSQSSFSGTILHINQKAEFTPKEILSPDNRQALVYAVKVSFENPDKVLKIGMPVDVFLK
ncbi:MAG: HlyD family efflux transporter periplasmic adaptor subunit [Calditrichia bacterium]|nr:HlyD family efflux transporter periplasmic adaptor subunit [Calditrichia bacterium]